MFHPHSTSNLQPPVEYDPRVVPFHYTPEVLEELCRHGAVPHGGSDPQMVRNWLSAVYKYEIRALQRQHRAAFHLAARDAEDSPRNDVRRRHGRSSW